VSIPTGIDLNFYKPSDKQIARMQLGISRDTFVFGTIATLRSWKGHEDLLNAYASLDNSESLLVLAGTGPQEDNLKSLAKALGIANNVLFLGHLDDPRPCLDLMDCFVFPSYANEGVPQAILQAMAYDLTIIGSDLPGVLEAVEGYAHFIKVPARNTNALANTMNGVLEIPPHKKTADAGIRVRISVDTMANHMAKLYEEFIRR
jgi:glycosyltransferase involved in cell wall biosynthesis